MKKTLLGLALVALTAPLAAQATYSNGGKYMTGNVFGDFGLVYAFNKTWAAHGGVHLNNDSTQTYGLGVRASF
ncbi:hypothetical protein [Dyella sp. Tek66A03]|uniref:hypothetical protein n=1 Tax=Dyella sp. Tek66A03 TaxID=3458298 RepID=UPI00403EF6CA